jgi:signal recognition particle GTPase
MLVAADVYRPAAIDQLTILGKKVIVFLEVQRCSECSSITYSSAEHI